VPDRHRNDHRTRLYKTFRQTDSVAVAAAKASISRATAYRIEADPAPPSQATATRGRRRPDPLAGIFDEHVVPMLRNAPDIRPIALFDKLLRRPRHRAPERALVSGTRRRLRGSTARR